MYSCPYRPWLGINHVLEVKKWCRNNIGDPTPMDNYFSFSMGGLWFTTRNLIHFKEERHAVLYNLMWSEG